MFRKHDFFYTWDAVLNTGPIYFNLVQNIGNDWKSSTLYHESICGNDLYTIALIWPLISCWACCTNLPLPNGFQIYLYHCLAHVLPSSYIHVDLRMWGWQCGQHLNWKMFSWKSTYSVQVLTPQIFLLDLWACKVCNDQTMYMFLYMSWVVYNSKTSLSQMFL